MFREKKKMSHTHARRRARMREGERRREGARMRRLGIPPHAVVLGAGARARVLGSSAVVTRATNEGMTEVKRSTKKIEAEEEETEEEEEEDDDEVERKGQETGEGVGKREILYR